LLCINNNTWTYLFAEDLGFVEVDPRMDKLWAFVYITLKQLYVTDFSSLTLPLYAVKKNSKAALHNKAINLLLRRINWFSKKM